MVIYDSEAIYIDSCSSIKEKIVAIDAIIAALFTTAAKAAAGEELTEYWLDDGQTKIKTVRRSSASIETSINSFLRLKNMYINQLNGRIVRLVDGKNFTGRSNAR